MSRLVGAMLVLAGTALLATAAAYAGVTSREAGRINYSAITPLGAAGVGLVISAERARYRSINDGE